LHPKREPLETLGRTRRTIGAGFCRGLRAGESLKSGCPRCPFCKSCASPCWSCVRISPERQGFTRRANGEATSCAAPTRCSHQRSRPISAAVANDKHPAPAPETTPRPALALECWRRERDCRSLRHARRCGLLRSAGSCRCSPCNHGDIANGTICRSACQGRNLASPRCARHCRIAINCMQRCHLGLCARC
jgi:hypothetical protein